MRSWWASRRGQAIAAGCALALVVVAVAYVVTRGGAAPGEDRLLAQTPEPTSSTAKTQTSDPTASPTPEITTSPTASHSESPSGGGSGSPTTTPSEPPHPLDADVVDVDLSNDGRFLAFTTKSANLVAGDTNGGYDAFVRDLATGDTVRASVDEDGKQLVRGMKNPFGISLSADGGRLLYNDSAGKLMVRDLAAKRTIALGYAAKPGSSSISADGGFVGFASSASDLVAGDTNGEDDAFLVDVANGKVTRVSVASDGSQGQRPANAGPSGQTITGFVEVSRGGTSVSFVSELTGLVTGSAETERHSYAYLHNLQTGTTEQLGLASEARLTPDGRWVAYRSGAGGGTFVWDAHAGHGDDVSDDALPVAEGLLQITDNGRYVLVVDGTGNASSEDALPVTVVDRTTKQARRVDVAKRITETAMAADGTVAFVALAHGRDHSVGDVCRPRADCAIATDR